MSVLFLSASIPCSLLIVYYCMLQPLQNKGNRYIYCSPKGNRDSHMKQNMFRYVIPVLNVNWSCLYCVFMSVCSFLHHFLVICWLLSKIKMLWLTLMYPYNDSCMLCQLILFCSFLHHFPLNCWLLSKVEMFWLTFIYTSNESSMRCQLMLFTNTPCLPLLSNLPWYYWSFLLLK